MKITRKALNFISKNISDYPPECGGILGSVDNNIITEIEIDKVESSAHQKCYYEPDVNYLNTCIELWAKKNISFKGVFHTHFFGVETLSESDKHYIRQIMQSMPKGINNLFFPVFVLPHRELICYKAEKQKESVNILLDETIIVT